ncbi:AAA family ATPase [Halopiger xanaduensis]|uniref:SMC domain protein n=1 Tax=Halopiger xanaduensis (strain DSM 18323 / JCM 14033 / SH-6) TaxID=797210 RepID=F8D8F6_HALXS|nr:AAA family ATPase [Halopiger xanaduensis]AEH35579.1 SMC domain protein [Halopiger xanaduensis SH-6]
MKFERLSLSDFQSYDNLDVTFDDGLTLLHGPNGAGKSTITRALYTTLYPLNGKYKIGAHDLADLIQDGKDSATSTLVFSVGDERYRITVDISRKGDGRASANAEMTNLESEETYSTKSSEIEEKVSQLFGMDAEAFANSTYAQQTELTRLIEATPGEREDILDNLLGLTAPDAYEEDINEMQKTVESWQQDKRSKLQTVQEDIEELEADDPKATVQSKAEEIDDLEARIGDLSDGLEDGRERLRAIESDIEEYRERESDLSDLTDERDEAKDTIDDLQSEIDELEAEIQECDEAIAKQRERIESRDDEVVDFDLTNEDEAKEAVEEFETKYDEASSEVEQRRAEVDSAEDTVERLEDELQSQREELEDAQNRLHAREADVEAAEETLGEAKDSLEQRREILEEQLQDYLETPLDDVDDHEAAVRDRMDDIREEKSDREAEYESKRDRRARLGDEIDTIESELSEVRERRDDIRESLETAVDDPEVAFEAAVDRANEAASALGFDVSAEDIDTAFTGDLPDELDAALNDHRDAAEELADARETVGEATAHIEDLQSLAAGKWPLDGGDVGATHDYDTQIQRLESEREEAETAADAAIDTLDAADERLNHVQEVADALFEAASFKALADVAIEIDDLEAEIEQKQQTRSELQDEMESLEEEISRLEEAIAEGETALDTIEDVEDAETAVDEAERELEDARDELADIKEEIGELEAEIEDIESDLDDAREDVKDAEADLQEAEEQLDEVESARSAAREARDAHAEIATLESDQKGYRSRLDDKEEQVASKREELQQIEDEIEEVESDLEDTSPDDLKEQQNETETLIEQVESQLEDAQERRDEARDAKSKAEERLNRLRDKRERKASLEEQVNWAQTLLNDFETITKTYSEVQTRMRERVLDRLKRHTNDIFRDLYQNSTYEAVDIDENYDLRLVSGSETARDPNKASGGEGVLVTIALRAGVYRVLADQAGGRDDSLPPFILDEPTNHLDPTHIDRLEDAVESIRDWDVPQVFVVDRYEGLVEGADHRIRVERDDGAGASKVVLGDGTGDADDDESEGGD